MIKYSFILSFLLFIGLPSIAQPVALTIDLCGGASDVALLEALWSYKQPAALFVTNTWIRSNPKTAQWLADKQSVFRIENHGYQHIEANLSSSSYGLPHTKTKDAIISELTSSPP
jgi:peptidoglycan/xylan/chitin deacetylase (PgdA/CDA1 family)